jgi:prepilin-type N-terminal cleavage/methylation domain-containing protein
MKKGFTLVEILIAVGIFTFIVAGIFAVLNVANLSWRSDMGLVDLQQQTRHAVDVMVRELRQAKQETLRPISITPDGGQITFFIPGSSNSVSYYLQGNQLLREHPVGTIPPTVAVLANNVDNLAFCCWIGNVCGPDCTDSVFLQMQLRATKNVGRSVLCFPVPCTNPPQLLTEEVRLRNE